MLSLRQLCETEGILVTELAVHHTVLVPGTTMIEGVLMRPLLSYSELGCVMNRVDATVMQLGLACSVVLMHGGPPIIVPKWKEWGTIVGDVEWLDIPPMAKAAGPLHREHAQQILETMADLLHEGSVCIDGSIPPTLGEWRLKGIAWFNEMALTGHKRRKCGLPCGKQTG